MATKAALDHTTRTRILEAAGEVFAAQGFGSATVREICAKAGANVASINYHFGDKARLYSEVLRFAYAQSIAKYPPQVVFPDSMPPEQRLHRFVHAFVSRVLDHGRPCWHAQLMSREMMEPTHALQQVVRENIQPQFEALCSIISQLIGRSSTDRCTKRCAASVVGQILHYHQCSQVVKQITPDIADLEHHREELVEHIVTFSLAGLNAFRKEH